MAARRGSAAVERNASTRDRYSIAALPSARELDRKEVETKEGQCQVPYQGSTVALCNLRFCQFGRCLVRLQLRYEDLDLR